MAARMLRVRKETLAELATADLGAVVGGGSLQHCSVVCIPTDDCTGYYPSLNAPCTD